MKYFGKIALWAGIGLWLNGCSKSSMNTAKDNGPDNAFTRYGENLAQSERTAKQVADKANAAVAQEQTMGNQATHESGDQPQ